VNLSLAVLLAVPLIVAFGSGRRLRTALALTLTATWVVTLVAYERVVPDRDLLGDRLVFFWIYIHLVTAPIAGTLASLLMRGGRGAVWSILAALGGSLAAVVIDHVLSLAVPGDRLARVLDIAGPVALASTLAVLAASLGTRRKA
jgi:uncharacterized membrane protein YeaQ/YmgE (transglycosylase-associated protein family)